MGRSELFLKDALLPLVLPLLLPLRCHCPQSRRAAMLPPSTPHGGGGGLLLLLCALLSAGGVAEAARRSTGRAPRVRPIGGWRQAEPVKGRPSTVNCTWGNFSQKIDHFGDAPGTFPQRYCMYDKWWRNAAHSGFKAAAGAPGPILFYTGNESPVEEYINNTGLMWELGEQMGALLVFAEHRYEPLSHPALCGKGTQKCFAYCTTAQANADWAALITELRTKHTIRAPAVAFGGSCERQPHTHVRHTHTPTKHQPRYLARQLSVNLANLPAVIAHAAPRRRWDARGLVPYEIPRRHRRCYRRLGANLAARGDCPTRYSGHAGRCDHPWRLRGRRFYRPVRGEPARRLAAAD